MSEAVEIAQPAGREAVSTAWRTAEERRDSGRGRVPVLPRGPSRELRMALKRT